jgi:hypothetical protein
VIERTRTVVAVAFEAEPRRLLAGAVALMQYFSFVSICYAIREPGFHPPSPPSTVLKNAF